MNLAKISANGQITVPVEIRRLLGLKSGDKILFFQKQDGEVVIRKASTQAIRKAQVTFIDISSIVYTVLRSRKIIWLIICMISFTGNQMRESRISGY